MFRSAPMTMTIGTRRTHAKPAAWPGFRPSGRCDQFWCGAAMASMRARVAASRGDVAFGVVEPDGGVEHVCGFRMFSGSFQYVGEVGVGVGLLVGEVRGERELDRLAASSARGRQQGSRSELRRGTHGRQAVDSSDMVAPIEQRFPWRWPGRSWVSLHRRARRRARTL